MITIKTYPDFIGFKEGYIEVNHEDFEAYYEPSREIEWRLHRKTHYNTWKKVEPENLPFNGELVKLLFSIVGL